MPSRTRAVIVTSLLVPLDEIADRLADHRRALGQAHLGDITLDVERFAHGRRGTPVARLKPIGEAQEDQPDDQQTKAGREIVEHAEGLAGHVLAHAARR